jgi:hypothetical protein
MERLTKTYSDGTHGASDSLSCGENSYDYKNLLIEKLGKYEDLEEQGKLIKIPLEAYCIVDFEVRKGFVLEETYNMSRKPLLVVRYDDNSFKSHSGYLGISVFLTKSEAEAKLKELRGGENDSMEA